MICSIAWYQWPPYWKCEVEWSSLIENATPVTETTTFNIDLNLFLIYVFMLALAGIIGSIMVWWVDVKLENVLDNAEKREEAKRLSRMWHP